MATRIFPGPINLVGPVWGNTVVDDLHGDFGTAVELGSSARILGKVVYPFSFIARTVLFENSHSDG